MQKNTIADQVMSKIDQKKIWMRPRWYFWIYNTSIFALTAIAIFSIIFLVNFSYFLLFKEGPGYGKLALIQSLFPWWIIPVGILSLILGIWAYRRSDLSYKLHPFAQFGLLLIAIISGILLLETSGLNDIWLMRGRLRYNNSNYEEINSPRQKWQSPLYLRGKLQDN